jgi:hypothetical protein
VDWLEFAKDWVFRGGGGGSEQLLILARYFQELYTND